MKLNRFLIPLFTAFAVFSAFGQSHPLSKEEAQAAAEAAAAAAASESEAQQIQALRAQSYQRMRD